MQSNKRKRSGTGFEGGTERKWKGWKLKKKKTPGNEKKLVLGAKN